MPNLGLPKSVAENIICKSLMDEGNHFVDCIYHDQRLLLWTGMDKNGECVVFHIERPGEKILGPNARNRYQNKTLMTRHFFEEEDRDAK